MAARIELGGVLIAAPELRVTPAGTPILRLMIDCGDAPGELVLSVVMTGESVRAIATGLGIGSRVQASGTLRALRGSRPQAFEVVADQIVPDVNRG